jgi:hypothetical protein
MALSLPCPRPSMPLPHGAGASLAAGLEKARPGATAGKGQPPPGRLLARRWPFRLSRLPQDASNLQGDPTPAQTLRSRWRLSYALQEPLAYPHRCRSSQGRHCLCACLNSASALSALLALRTASRAISWALLSWSVDSAFVLLYDSAGRTAITHGRLHRLPVPLLPRRAWRSKVGPRRTSSRSTGPACQGLSRC